MLVLGVFCVFPLHAQNDIKTWKEGRLEWKDFYQSERIGDTISFPAINYSIKREKIKGKGTTLIYKDVTAAFYRNMSWVAPSFANDEELEKDQAYFDIVEITARQFRDSLLFNNVKEKDLTRHFLKVADQMRKSGQKYEVPEDSFDIKAIRWEDTQCGFGLSLGPSLMLPFRALGELSGPIPCLSFIGTGYFGKAVLAAEINYGKGMAKNKYYGTEGVMGPGVHQVGDYVPYFSATLNGGYSFIDNDKLRVFALAGPGFSHASLYYHPVNGLLLNEGIGADLKLHNWVSLSGKHSHVETSVRFKVSCGQILNFSNRTFLPLMNFSISVNFPCWKVLPGQAICTQ